MTTGKQKSFLSNTPIFYGLLNIVMMLNSKEMQTLDEFCENGKLNDYRSLLTQIFERIIMGKCKIAAQYNCNKSLHSFDLNSCIIRISLSKTYNNPIEIIWTLFHEFGHHKSGKIDKKLLDPVTTLRREQEAWDLARQEILIYPELLATLSEFEKYKQKCLEGYEKAASI
ncbi:MAG: hypothetical protein ABI480_00295 [Chitinophagaceae bacterium]